MDKAFLAAAKKAADEKLEGQIVTFLKKVPLCFTSILLLLDNQNDDDRKLDRALQRLRKRNIVHFDKDARQWKIGGNTIGKFGSGSA